MERNRKEKIHTKLPIAVRDRGMPSPNVETAELGTMTRDEREGETVSEKWLLLGRVQRQDLSERGRVREGGERLHYRCNAKTMKGSPEEP